MFDGDDARIEARSVRIEARMASNYEAFNLATLLNGKTLKRDNNLMEKARLQVRKLVSNLEPADRKIETMSLLTSSDTSFDNDKRLYSGRLWE